ncbi:MFS transporter [Sphingopyxis sp. OPL5]|uniref:MFS transporter n=1 Tax=Sphingopyxis sp. OPL5 TaxID=2486273 RepID=UPI00164DD8CE|nr:MFS transporter [Sphingopyxis sp. OPL5]QNO25564.1 MFS transporter [Sphingopyxis sp. OPL5]
MSLAGPSAGLTPRAQWTLALLQLISWGSFFYAFSVLALPMEIELGWSRPAIMMAMSLALVVAGLSAPVVGSAIDRGHGRWVMTFGSLLGAAMLLLWSASSAKPALYAAWAGLGVAQAMTFYDAGFAALTRRLGGGAPRAIMRMTLLGGFAGTVFIPLTGWLVDTWGWRDALMILAAINILVAAPLHWAALAGDTVDAQDASDHAAPAPAWSAALRERAFWMLVVTFCSWSLAFGSLTFHLLPLLAERGISDTMGIALLASVGPLQIAGRIGLMLYRGTMPARLLGRSLTAALVAAILLLYVAGANIWMIAAGVALYGIANGMVTILRGIAVAHYLGVAGFGRKSGMISAINGFALALAPYAAGLLWTGGGYALVLAGLAGAASVGALAFWSLPAAGRTRADEA